VIDVSGATDSPPDIHQWVAGGDPQLRTEGFIFQIVLAADHVYAAAGIDGLVRWDETSSPRWQRDLHFNPGSGDVVSIAPVRFAAGTQNRVVVARNSEQLISSTYGNHLRTSGSCFCSPANGDARLVPCQRNLASRVCLPEHETGTPHPSILSSGIWA